MEFGDEIEASCCQYSLFLEEGRGSDSCTWSGAVTALLEGKDVTRQMQRTLSSQTVLIRRSSVTATRLQMVNRKVSHEEIERVQVLAFCSKPKIGPKSFVWQRNELFTKQGWYFEQLGIPSVITTDTTELPDSTPWQLFGKHSETRRGSPLIARRRLSSKLAFPHLRSWISSPSITPVGRWTPTCGIRQNLPDDWFSLSLLGTIPWIPFHRSGMLHFYQDLRWVSCCWARGHIVRSTALDRIWNVFPGSVTTWPTYYLYLHFFLPPSLFVHFFFKLGSCVHGTKLNKRHFSIFSAVKIFCDIIIMDMSYICPNPWNVYHHEWILR